MHSAVTTYLEQHRGRFLEELDAFLCFPSISAQAAHDEDTRACAQWLTDHFAQLGLDAELIDTDGQPIVSAVGGPTDAPKLLIYGHYDVQPEDPLDQWRTPPFEPTIRDGFLYARGATDDKGQLFAHVKAVEALLKTGGELPCRVQFLVEGEEESNGAALEHYIAAHGSELACDAVVISDCGMYDEKTPAITYGLRGVCGFEITVCGPDRDLHSGSFGGAVANPAIVLAQILGQCVDSQGRITIGGFHDAVRPLAGWEEDNLKKLACDEAALAAELGVPRTFGDPDYNALARMWARPTFDVNGIYGGYTGPGGKTIIPASASAKITMRIVPDQHWEDCVEKAVRHIRSVCPDTVTLDISEPFGGDPVLFDTDHRIVQAACDALQEGFGAAPVFMREGGSIPVVNTFASVLQAPVILMGLGLNTDGAHSPNERFKLDNFYHGMAASAALLSGMISR